MKNEFIRIHFDEDNVAEITRWVRDLRDGVAAVAPNALINMGALNAEGPDIDLDDSTFTLVTIVTTEASVERVREAVRWWRCKNVGARVRVEGDEGN